MNDLQAHFRSDGVVFIPNAFDQRTLMLADQAFQWTYSHPGPGAGAVLHGVPGTIYQDQANPDCFPAYRELLETTPIPDIATGLFGSNKLWLLYEQIWFKDANSRRTPWHQDMSYWPLEGDDLCVMWVPLTPVSQDTSLEFVTGSHRGPLYNPSAFSAQDEAAALFSTGAYPPLPNIEAARDQWPIVSWAMQPGDVVIFHPATLHGGAPTYAGQPRRTLSLRFFGEHAYCATRPGGGLADVEGLKHRDGGRHPLKKMAKGTPGTLFRHPDFPQLRP